MKKSVFLIYGAVSYVIFLGTFLYLIGFIGNILVPVAIDSEPRSAFGISLLINMGLLGIFALQHSGMARPTFKKWWTQYIPEEIERSTYVLFTNIALILLFVFWQPLGGIVWHVSNPTGVAILYGLFALGWIIVLVATFLIDHFDLFGLRQVWLFFRGIEYKHKDFRSPFLYKYVRHPLYVGFFIAFWATPTMTVTHLVFAIVTTLYILIATQLEERNLKEFLPEYAEYQRKVPMYIPRLFGKK